MLKTKLLFLFTLLSGLLMAQQRVITGNITGGDPPEPLIGANVLIKGTSLGEITDFDGNFSLEVPSQYDTLIISYTGFKAQEIAIGDQSIIAVELISDNALLDEVVVIGYGIQKKRVATGAISKLSAENLEGFQVQNVQSALEGQVSGLIVSESSGQPGSSKSILIRGVSTNGDNSPLFVVDGLQVDNIDNINPSDIESVDVLKDAATTAIYGARAANGVVIITTKKGSDGDGEITYEGFFSTSRPWKLPEMLGSSDYIDITREKFENGRQLSSLETLGFPTSAEGLPNTSWMDVIFNDANVESHRLSARMKDLYLSMEYWDQNGVIGGDKSNYKRYSVRLNGSKDINDYVKIGENIYINRVENQSINENDAFGTVLADAFAYDPITEVYNEDKDYGFEQSRWVQKEYINPLSRLFLADNDGHADQILGNVYLEVKPFENLILHSDVGLDYSWFNFRSFVPDYRYHPSFINVSNDISQGYGFNQAFQFENYLNYTRSMGDHNFNVVIGTSYRETEGEQAGGSTSFIPDAVKFDDNFQIIDAGQDTLDLAYGNINVDYRLISYYGRLIYDYKGKYLLTGTIRRDGSSNFGSANRFGVFPSFSAGWVISDEPFFQNVGPISFLKLRTSWGINGNDRINPLSFASRVENVFSYPFGRNPSLNQGSSLATPPNPNIKWEESIQLDIGLEMRLWNDQLTAEFDYFRKNTSDLLMDRLIPGYVGATNNPISNLGEIQNAGFEAAINYKVYLGGLRIQTGLNYTTFTNEVINVAGESGFIPGWSWPVRNTPITRMTEGLPVGHFVGYKTDGIFQSQQEVFSHINSQGELLQPRARPGDIRFVDINGDGVINSDDITNIGSPWPDHIIGLTFNASYKGFDLTAVFSSQLGHEIFRAYERSDITFTNYQTFWKDRWTPENPSSELPRLVSTDPNNNQRPSDFYLEDGSFLRLRNIQLGYNISNQLLEKVNLKGLRIYFTANNLMTLTNYRGFDPEIGTTGWILDTGIDKGFYPSNTTYGFGVKVTM